MFQTYLLVTAGIISQGIGLSQTQPQVFSFQPAQTMAVTGRGMLPLPRQEKGKPFSATIHTQTTQTLGDGTQINNTTAMIAYRDADGRVRTETSQPDVAAPHIMIRDPIAGVNYVLDSQNKSALKQPGSGDIILLPAGITSGRGSGTASSPVQPQVTVERLRATTAALSLEAARRTQVAKNDPNTTIEDLGTQTVNGVPARGTRTTTVVPVGAIGNDREFRSIDERWFSPDLNMLIKSVNTDPRFGTTTYEMTNINRQTPDSWLFEVPADYTINAGGRGRGQ